MRRTPDSIKTSIVRDLPGRFVLEQVELERLLLDIRSLLGEEGESQHLRVRYWVGLQNGIIYETENLDVVLSEENAQSLTIQLFIVFGELLDEEMKTVRSIIVHFGRGRPRASEDRLELEDGGWFNLDYLGLSYRVKKRNREAALDVIAKIEERLKKFQRWYSNIPRFDVSPSYPTF
ncbi:MAG: hypothetical protein JXA14_27235 [Anaerolineae bacterium]|nr:hypothetical protein [Anaerolineae bacterium]